MSTPVPRRDDALDCLRCGACCLAPSAGALGWAGPLSPEEALMVDGPIVSCAAGLLVATTGASPNRCVHLRGEPGLAVTCAIYPRRPAACRDMPPGDPVCLHLRRTTLA